MGFEWAVYQLDRGICLFRNKKFVSGRQRDEWGGGEPLLMYFPAIIEALQDVDCTWLMFAWCSLNAPSPRNSQPQPGAEMKLANFNRLETLVSSSTMNITFSSLFATGPNKTFSAESSYKTNFSSEESATFLYSRLNYHFRRPPFYFLQKLKCTRDKRLKCASKYNWWSKKK